MVGLLQPHSAFHYLLLAMTAGVALFLFSFQFWTLAPHTVLSADGEQLLTPRQGTHDHGSDGLPTMNASATSSAAAGSA